MLSFGLCRTHCVARCGTWRSLRASSCVKRLSRSASCSLSSSLVPMCYLRQEAADSWLIESNIAVRLSVSSSGYVPGNREWKWITSQGWQGSPPYKCSSPWYPHACSGTTDSLESAGDPHRAGSRSRGNPAASQSGLTLIAATPPTRWPCPSLLCLQKCTCVTRAAAQGDRLVHPTRVKPDGAVYHEQHQNPDSRPCRWNLPSVCGQVRASAGSTATQYGADQRH